MTASEPSTEPTQVTESTPVPDAATPSDSVFQDWSISNPSNDGGVDTGSNEPADDNSEISVSASTKADNPTMVIPSSSGSGPPINIVSASTEADNPTTVIPSSSGSGPPINIVTPSQETPGINSITSSGPASSGTNAFTFFNSTSSYESNASGLPTPKPDSTQTITLVCSLAIVLGVFTFLVILRHRKIRQRSLADGGFGHAEVDCAKVATPPDLEKGGPGRKSVIPANLPPADQMSLSEAARPKRQTMDSEKLGLIQARNVSGFGRNSVHSADTMGSSASVGDSMEHTVHKVSSPDPQITVPQQSHASSDRISYIRPRNFFHTRSTVSSSLSYESLESPSPNWDERGRRW